VLKAVLFDLGNTLIEFWARPEFPEVLSEPISGVQDLLAGVGVLRVSPEVMWQRAAEEDHSLPEHRVYPLAERLARIFDVSSNRLLSSMCRFQASPLRSEHLLKIRQRTPPPGTLQRCWRSLLMRNVIPAPSLHWSVHPLHGPDAALPIRHPFWH